MPSLGGEANPKPQPRQSLTESIRTCAKRFNWRERARAYDHAAEAARERARLTAVAEDERRKYAALRRRDAQSIDLAAHLKVKALKMLQWPMEEVTSETRTVEDDGRTLITRQVIAPAKWTLRDAAFLLRVARELEDAVYFPGGQQMGRANPPAEAQPVGGDGFQSNGAAPVGGEDAESDDEIEAAARQTLGAWMARQQRRMLEAPAPPATPPPADEASGGERREAFNGEGSAESGAEWPNGQEGPQDAPGRIRAAARSDLSRVPPRMRQATNGAADRGPIAAPLGSGRRPAGPRNPLVGRDG